MNTIRRVLSANPYIKLLNWKLLIFLVLFLHVKLVVKIAAIVFICFLQPNFRFGFRWNESRLPLFYPFIIGLTIVTALFNFDLFRQQYAFVLCFAILLWLCSLLAVHHIKLLVEQSNAIEIYYTLLAFFLANIFVTLAELLRIMVETGSLNPFQYQGNYQKYFINTGDYLKGISFDTSTTNAVLNAFGIVFFLYKRSWLMVMVCTITLLLTASNLVNLLLFFTLLSLFFFKSGKDHKSIIVISFALSVTFVSKISPQNNQYVAEVTERILHSLKKEKQEEITKIDVRNIADDSLSAEQIKEKLALLYLDSLRRVYLSSGLLKQDKVLMASNKWYTEKPALPKDNIHSAPFQSRNDTNLTRQAMLRFLSEKRELLDIAKDSNSRLPGKAIAYLQTGRFFLQHPQKLIFGTGPGNFSSKTAFKATGLGVTGSIPGSFEYLHPDFAVNHLSLYLRYFSQPAKKHSIINSPNSVYSQLLSEYGLIGLAAFVVFYVGFFLRQYKKMTYSLPLLFLLLGMFLFDYWFEQLSIVVLFELLFFLDRKENSKQYA